MGRTLRILYVEKSARVAERLISHFTQVGIGAVVSHLSDEKKLSVELDNHPWDILICDFDIPTANGFDIIKMIKKMGKNLPIIFVSDNTNEDIKIDALQAGACDFIQKRHIKSLLAAVWREINNFKKLDEFLLFEKGLLESERFLLDVFNTVEEGICVVDNDLNILRVNSWINKLFENSASVCGKKCHMIYKNSMKQCNTCPSLNTFKTGNMNQELFQVNHPAGKISWLDLTTYPLKNTNGEIVGVIHSVKDVTRRKLAEQKLLSMNKNLEQRVAFRTAQLAAMNTELESFAYSVSHDLRAPLVRIDGFSQLLIDSFSDQLNDEGKHFVSRIRSSVLQMSQLIDDLLQLSRVTRSEMNFSTVDLTKLAHHISDSLMELEPERKATFVIQKDLTAAGDMRLLKLALENLFNNAWKFTQKKSNTRIEFGYQNSRPEPYFYIRDNGAGFNNSYVNKLFSPFQRLHTESDFPGTGIGLATVKRIVHRHGGQVWADGEVNKGATFYFTLRAE